MNKPRILITRPLQDAELLADALVDAGFRTLVEPLTIPSRIADSHEIIRNAVQSGVEGIILTSRHALGALSEISRELPLFAVGVKTAQAARMADFTHVHQADGNVDSLLRLIQTFDYKKLLYPCGKHISRDLQQALSPAGYEVVAVPVYEAVAIEALSEFTIGALSEQSIRGAVFYSRRHAEIFVNLATQAGLVGHFDALHAFAVGANAAQALESLPWEQIHICTTESVVATLRSTLK